MQKRALTINFERSVVSGVAEEVEVVVAPLATPSAPNQNVTLIDGPSRQTIVLANEVNPVIFYLTPTDHPDLTQRVTYRVAWRKTYMGRQFTHDFVMPDFDVDFDDLSDLGNIIGGETYLQWTDRGVPGGVAALNNQGQVVDADGNIVGSDIDGATKGELQAEAIARQQGDNNVRDYLLQYVQDQVSQIYSSTSTNLVQAVGQLQNADVIEKAQRIAAVNAVNSALSALELATNSQIGELNELLDQYNESLDFKADLVDGKIPTSQLPDVSLGRAVTVDDEEEMLGLTSEQVQPGDFAVRPDGVWFLNAAPPSVLANWVPFTVAATVFSVNGQTGAVVLSAADVGARPEDQPIPQADIEGLATTLSGKVSVSDFSDLAGRVSDIESDEDIVKKVSGLIPKADMPADVAFVTPSNLIAKKDGTVLNLGGGGGTLDIEDVNGLQDALDDKLDADDPSVTNARTPIAHAATHASGGSDPIEPSDIGAAESSHTHAQGDITGLLTTLTGHNTRIGSLESRVEDLESGEGGGGGGGSSAKTVWYSETGYTTDLDNVLIRSPFGFDGTDYYYDPAGADVNEAVWPYLTPNGHLKFIKRNESAPEDEELATEAALNALALIVSGKADQSDLSSLASTVASKANQSDLSSLASTVSGKASQADLNDLADLVANKASQDDLDLLSGTVSTKANQSDLSSLASTVAGKANAVHTHEVVDITGLQSALDGKAAAAHTHTIANITNLQSTLDAKAPLVSGTVPVANIPNLPTSKITNLDATLAAKADLDENGKVPTGQLPALSLTTAVTVASRSAMLALNTSQVQPGDIAVITATSDKGSYILTAPDPSQFSNWVKLVAPDDAVQSVNGQSGTVVLTAADVGARPAGVQVPQSDVTGLVTALGSKADTSALTSGLAGKTSPTDVQSILTSATLFKQKADLVATSAVGSLSGQQSIDGTLTPLGAVVLVTAQSSSVNNGLYTVNSGAWTRVPDMAAGNPFIKGSVVVVTNGANHANSLWQETNDSGVVGTNANNWAKILTAGAPPVYTGSLGVTKVGNDFRAQVVSGGGLQVVTGGLQLDPSVAPRKYAADVPGGSTIATITHNLNTTDVIAWFRDKTTGDAVLAGWKPTGVNTISVEFATPPATGQWRVVVIG